MHDGIDQRFLNIEGQSGVGNNILQIMFVVCFQFRILCSFSFLSVLTYHCL
jgi:hypothetical protein